MQLKNKLHLLMDLPHKLFRQFGISCREINCWPTVPAKFVVCLDVEEHWAGYNSLWIMTIHINI